MGIRSLFAWLSHPLAKSDRYLQHFRAPSPHPLSICITSSGAVGLPWASPGPPWASRGPPVRLPQEGGGEWDDKPFLAIICFLLLYFFVNEIPIAIYITLARPGEIRSLFAALWHAPTPPARYLHYFKRGCGSPACLPWASAMSLN